MNPTRTSVVLMERRQVSRAPANRAATLRFALTELRCTVVDVSAGGAGLTLEGTADLPASVSLLIDGESASRTCRVVWSDADRAGVAFE